MEGADDPVRELRWRVLSSAKDQRPGWQFAAGRRAALDVTVPERPGSSVRLRIVLVQDLGVDPAAQFFGRHIKEDVQDALTALADQIIIAGPPPVQEPQRLSFRNAVTAETN